MDQPEDLKHRRHAEEPRGNGSAPHSTDVTNSSDKDQHLLVAEDDPLWQTGLEVVGVLEHHGYPAYLVGGCVRDRKLGRLIHDIDITTAAKPEEVMALFPAVLPTGLQHGTVTVKHGGYAFEVTTFRQESTYSDARHPDAVAFVLDVREDLARRDFTINAMAVGEAGTLLDPFHGCEDLDTGLIRAVGEADQRFDEDALRMIRGVRFAAEFGFAMEPDTWHGLLLRRDKLQKVAMERIGVELDKMIAGRNPPQAIAMLLSGGLLVFTKEPLPGTVLQAWQTLHAAGRVIGEHATLLADLDQRWALILLEGGAGQGDAMAWFRALHYRIRRAERVEAIIGFQRSLSDPQVTASDDSLEEEWRKRWIRTTLAYGREAALDWMQLLKVSPALGAHLTKLTAKDIGTTFPQLAGKWLQELAVAKTTDLALKGDELLRHAGITPGPWVAEQLRILLEEVAFGVTPNEKSALLAAFERNRLKER